MKAQEGIKERYARVAGTLDERGRRAVAASEALAIGWGGITAVSRATGVSRKVIELGIKELNGIVPSAPAGRIRRPGGGRKKTVERDPSVQADLERLVEPMTRGDPESPLRWTCKSVRKLAAALCAQGHRVSHAWVAGVLRELGYSLQGNRKTREGGDHPERDAQFAHINDAVGKVGEIRRCAERASWNVRQGPIPLGGFVRLLCRLSLARDFPNSICPGRKLDPSIARPHDGTDWRGSYLRDG